MASMQVSCSELDTLDQLRTYEPLWRELFAHSAQPSIFSSWDWFFNWWKCVGSSPESFTNEIIDRDGSPLFLIQVHNAGNELVALIPFYCAFKSSGKLRLRILRMVGEIEEVENNPNEEPVVVLKRGYENATIAALRQYMHFRPFGTDWTYASITLPLAGAQNDSTTTFGRFNALVMDRIYRRYIRTTEILALPEDWEVFKRSLTKSMRDNLKYYPRLIERHGHIFAIRVARTVQEIAEASAVLIDLHRSRTHASHGVPHLDHFATKAHQLFFQETHADLAAYGHASIYILSIDGVDVAAQSVLEGPEGFVFYYSGFDPAWHMYSPLTILSAEILRDAIDRKVTSVNLLHFSRLWKTRWGARSVDRSEGVTCVRLHIPSLVKIGFFFGTTRHSRRVTADQREAKPHGNESLL